MFYEKFYGGRRKKGKEEEGISEQRGHSRIGYLWKPANWPSSYARPSLADGKTRGTAAGFSRRLRLPPPPLFIFLPGSCSFYIRLHERGCREGNNRMERLSVSRLPSNLRFDTLCLKIFKGFACFRPRSNERNSIQFFWNE